MGAVVVVETNFAGVFFSRRRSGLSWSSLLLIRLDHVDPREDRFEDGVAGGADFETPSEEDLVFFQGLVLSRPVRRGRVLVDGEDDFSPAAPRDCLVGRPVEVVSRWRGFSSSSVQPRREDLLLLTTTSPPFVISWSTTTLSTPVSTAKFFGELLGLLLLVL